MNDLSKLAQLGPREAWLLGRIWLCLGGFSLALRWISLPKLQSFIQRRLRPGQKREFKVGPREIEELDRWVRVAARRQPLRALCLERSLTLQYLLARQGCDSQLRIGARSHDGALEAHAWLEIDGAPVGEVAAVDQHYPVLRSISASTQGIA